MAKAEKIPAKTEEIKDTFGGGVTITLDYTEAAQLKAIMGNITGGGPLRVLADEIYWSFGDDTTGRLSPISPFSKNVDTIMHVKP